MRIVVQLLLGYFISCAAQDMCGEEKLMLSEGLSDNFRLLKEFIKSAATNETAAKELEEHFLYWRSFDFTIDLPPFDCAPPKPDMTAPTSVHRLKPEHIDLVAAMGDSITAGCGANAKKPVGLLTEWRGVSWSIGGDQTIEKVFTIPNMLRVFNRNLKGYSKGTTTTTLWPKPDFSNKIGLNMAVSGAVSGNMKNQAKRLVTKIRKSDDMNLEDDWKLVTLFIGGNDICASCQPTWLFGDHSVEAYRKNIDEALLYLRDNLPRALVNVVLMMDVTELQIIAGTSYCNKLNQIFCPCITKPDGPEEKKDILLRIIEYSETILDLILAKDSYDKDDQFTVVAQPFLVNTRMPLLEEGEPDTSYFAPDCFHFSGKGHANAANALWNNMFQPAGKKRLSWLTAGQSWNCPTEGNPYIFTYKNSGSSSSKRGRPRDEF